LSSIAFTKKHFLFSSKKIKYPKIFQLMFITIKKCSFSFK